MAVVPDDKDAITDEVSFVFGTELVPCVLFCGVSSPPSPPLFPPVFCTVFFFSRPSETATAGSGEDVGWSHVLYPGILKRYAFSVSTGRHALVLYVEMIAGFEGYVFFQHDVLFRRSKVEFFIFYLAELMRCRSADSHDPINLQYQSVRLVQVQ